MRKCGLAEADTVVDILVGAFHDDPTWSWVFPDAGQRPVQLRWLWKLLVEGALRYPSVWLDDDAKATAVWIRPGGTELSEEQEAALEPGLVELLGPSAASRVLAVFEAFGEAHPHDEPHYYLSLLGTRVSERGHGYGLALLAETLRVVDEAGMAAYLEASNPANVALYERYGFVPAGSFALPGGGRDVATMWRQPAPATTG
jgi:ribosomal protein S18 acetylase RimI-like enzyme